MSYNTVHTGLLPPSHLVSFVVIILLLLLIIIIPIIIIIIILILIVSVDMHCSELWLEKVAGSHKVAGREKAQVSSLAEQEEQEEQEGEQASE